MTITRISCEGVVSGSIVLPPFELHAGHMLCMHIPWPGYSRLDQHLLDLLVGKRPMPGLIHQGAVRWAEPACYTLGWRGWFYQPSVETWLYRAAQFSRAEAEAILDRIQLQPKIRVCQLGYNWRVLLGLEATWSRRGCHHLFSHGM